jgi:hypothetical protein
MLYARIYNLSHVCYMPRSSNPPWNDHPNTICRTAQLTLYNRTEVFCLLKRYVILVHLYVLNFNMSFRIVASTTFKGNNLNSYTNTILF